MGSSLSQLANINLQETSQTPWDLAYGPVQSRRLGQSLGINLLGKNKLCSFDCPYCDLGPTILRLRQLKAENMFPDPLALDEQLRFKIKECHNQGQLIDTLTLSGQGEPTLHPFFLDCVQLILKIRDELLPNKKVVILTNGAHCDLRKVVQGLNQLDERMVKVDAGRDDIFKVVNRPLIRAHMSKIVSGCRKLKDVIVQSFFVQGAIDNTQLSDIEDWLEVIGMIQPKTVHLLTLHRTPVMAGLKKVDEDTLYTIASRLKRKLQIDSTVFP